MANPGKKANVSGWLPRIKRSNNGVTELEIRLFRHQEVMTILTAFKRNTPKKSISY
jgi:hypothetical protein